MNNYILTSIILSYFFLITAFVYGIFYTQVRINKLCKWYIIYLGFILSIEIFTLFSIYILESKTTQYLYPFYISGEFLLLVSFFLKELGAPKISQIIKWIVACCIFIETILLWFINHDASTGYAKAISHLTIICLAAILLIKNIKDLETNNPLSIIYAALFLYYSVSLFLFLIMNQLTKNNISIWIINNILSSVLYGSSVYAFYRLKKW